MQFCIGLIYHFAILDFLFHNQNVMFFTIQKILFFHINPRKLDYKQNFWVIKLNFFFLHMVKHIFCLLLKKKRLFLHFVMRFYPHLLNIN